MNKLTRYCFIFCIVAGLTIGNNTTLASEQYLEDTYSANTITVTIDGLDEKDCATLIISPENSMSKEMIILEKGVNGSNSKKPLTLTTNLKDGNYQLVLDTTDKYFRKPKGYFFTVLDGKVINNRDDNITFELIPPEERNYKPYRGSTEIVDTKNAPEPELPKPGETPYRLEYFLSLLKPEKQGIPQQQYENKGDTGYYYFSPATTYDAKGIWGKMDVVNPGVRHGIYPYQEFAINHIYATRWIDHVQYWMEIGWIEHSWQLDYRYLWEFDSTEGEFRYYFQVSSTNEVAIVHDTGTTWIAYWNNGSSWIQMAYEDLGIYTADNIYNGGEVYTYDGTQPSYPTAYTTKSKLYDGSSWDTWDTDYSTFFLYKSPYYSSVITPYYYFYVYKS